MTRLYARRGVLLGGYRTLGSFDKCPFRFWLAVNVSQRSTSIVHSSNRPGHRSSGQHGRQLIVFLVSVTLSRTSDGLDCTKVYHRSPLKLVSATTPQLPLGCSANRVFQGLSPFMSFYWRGSLIPPLLLSSRGDWGTHSDMLVSMYVGVFFALNAALSSTAGALPFLLYRNNDNPGVFSISNRSIFSYSFYFIEKEYRVYGFG
jgi:hypothetical protein